MCPAQLLLTFQNQFAHRAYNSNILLDKPASCLYPIMPVSHLDKSKQVLITADLEAYLQSALSVVGLIIVFPSV